MICPDCGGSGRIRRRFLIFFTRRTRCRKCLGTGAFPPAVRPQVRVSRSSAARDWDDDRWTPRSFGSPSSRSESDRDSFDVGSGGRSGGGGATASWDVQGEAPPVIAEPFSDAATSAADGVISSDPADSTASTDSSPSSSESSDGGTSY